MNTENRRVYKRKRQEVNVQWYFLVHSNVDERCEKQDTNHSKNNSREKAEDHYIIRNICSSYEVQYSMSDQQQSSPVVILGSERCVVSFNEKL